MFDSRNGLSENVWVNVGRVFMASIFHISFICTGQPPHNLPSLLVRLGDSIVVAVLRLNFVQAFLPKRTSHFALGE